MWFYYLLVSKLRTAKNIEKVKQILSYDFKIKEPYFDVCNLLYGYEDLKVLSEITDKKEIKEILKVMGMGYKNECRNPFVMDLFSQAQ